MIDRIIGGEKYIARRVENGYGIWEVVMPTGNLWRFADKERAIAFLDERQALTREKV